jgi:hypothetical protein
MRSLIEPTVGNHGISPTKHFPTWLYSHRNDSPAIPRAIIEMHSKALLAQDSSHIVKHFVIYTLYTRTLTDR